MGRRAVREYETSTGRQRVEGSSKTSERRRAKWAGRGAVLALLCAEEALKIIESTALQDVNGCQYRSAAKQVLALWSQM